MDVHYWDDLYYSLKYDIIEMIYFISYYCDLARLTLVIGIRLGVLHVAITALKHAVKTAEIYICLNNLLYTDNSK